MGKYHAWLRAFFCLWVALIGAMVAWRMRYEIDADALAYIDMAKAYLHTPWWQIPNGYWNPLFSYLIAGAFYLLRPASVWEVPMAEFVFWLTFVFAGLGYLYLERWLVKWQESRDLAPGRCRAGLGAATSLWF